MVSDQSLARKLLFYRAYLAALSENGFGRQIYKDIAVVYE
jgi:hypothetical protein